MSHLRPIPKRQCAECGWKRATVELFNDHNSSLGYFCGRCGRMKLARLIDRNQQNQPKENK